MSAVNLLPWSLHEAIEYLAGVFLILAPFIFGLRDSVAFPLFIGVGVVILLVALLTPGKAELSAVLPVRVHGTLDYLLGVFLIAAPFVFGFSENDPALFISVFLGVAHIVVTLITSFPVTDAGEATAEA